MVSICMAIKDGALFLREQIDSILPQLEEGDELIISDDHSSDESKEIILSYEDARIKLYTNTAKGIVSNFENALRKSRGDYIFLCDQDDVWLSNKVQIVCHHLRKYDLVVSDCLITSEPDLPLTSFYHYNTSGKGLLRNLFRNSYMGCCMAFRRTLLTKALPFPARIPMHDLWIGLVGELYFNVLFIPDQLVYHRRHHLNASTTSKQSTYPLTQRLGFRYTLIKNLILLSYA